MSHLPLVSFLTVNYNQPEVTVKLLQSLQNLNYGNWEVTVVDNGSKPSNLKDKVLGFSKAKFVETGKNLGFAGGNNAGLPYCKGEYIFFINNDTEVEPQLLDSLVELLEKDKQIGMISPKIRFYQGEQLIQYAGATAMSSITIRNNGIGDREVDRGQYDDIRETAYIHGAAMIVPRVVIEEVGPMYDDYFLYYEEYDWCERIRRTGYKILYCGLVTVYHKESVSTGQNSPLKVYYLTRNRLLFARRNYPSWRKILAILYFTFIALPKNVLSWTLKGRGDLAGAFIRGYIWNLKNQNKQ